MFPDDVTAAHDFESLDKGDGVFDALREAMRHAQVASLSVRERTAGLSL